ncbi:MAG: right-handed parallel beta-helix repeat-containing protein [Acidimicrobiia bacterium]
MSGRQISRFGVAAAALLLGLGLLPMIGAYGTSGMMQISSDTTLAEDHSGPIEVIADNVTLDCNGHSVTGTGSGKGISVNGHTGVSIQNCVVTGFQHGIALGTDTDKNSVTENTSFGNTANGINLFEADENTINNNTLKDNGLHGIAAYSSKLLTVNGNEVRDNGTSGSDGHGMKIRLTGGSTFTDNQADGNLLSGFFTDGVGNTFTGNDAHRNGEFGFDDDAMAGANAYSKNYCTGNDLGGSDPSGLCQEEHVGLVNTVSGEWHLRYGEGSVTSFYYGNPGDIPFLGDWDCDGNATPGLFRTSDAFAYLRNSNSQGVADIRFFFGNPSDIPLAGDFNGDGCDTLSIYRPSEARFYIVNELGDDEGGLGAADYSFLFGNVGDKPVVGDWDADGVDEIGLHRETTGFFYYRETLTTGNADGQFFFGDPGDRFVAGDWGVVDGVDTPAMLRPSNMTFYFRHTLTQGNADSRFVWPGAGIGWLPVSGGFTLD